MSGQGQEQQVAGAALRLIAQEDVKLKTDLLKRLKVRLGCAAEFPFELWHDGHMSGG